uniref:MFS domain-containing protein n=1 Tax=Rhabditophanes sp. KR3021 TaxID=114890 RepID=A0AC35TYW8_9BILA
MTFISAPDKACFANPANCLDIVVVKPTKMKFDDLLFSALGEFGKYQAIQFLLVCLPTMFTAMHSLSWTFTAPEIHHRCRIAGEADNDSYFRSIPSNIIDKTNCSFVDKSTCPFQNCRIEKLDTCPYGYIFDLPEGTYTAVNRWELVCGDSIWIAVIQGAYYAGQMAGSIIFGTMGDKFGRKKVFLVAIGIQIVAGFLNPVVPTWYLYALMRFAVGFAHPGIFVIAVIIGMELVGPSKRKLASVVTGSFFAIGQIVLGVLAYYLRDYTHLQAAIAAPTLLFLSYYWLVPESPRWLVSKKRYEDANKILKKAVKFNKSSSRSLPDKWWLELEDLDSPVEQAVPEKKYGYADLFKTPQMLRRSLVSFFMWPVVSMIYYGVAMKPDFLGGDIYVSFIFGGIMELPALFIVYLTIDRLGRKPLLIGGYLICSCCMILSLFLEGRPLHWGINLVLYAIVKGSITAVYASAYTFSPELFPTVIRNSAMGLCSTFARIGAILASFISMYLVSRYGRIYMVAPFASCGFLAAFMIWFLLPETNGKPLAETIDQIEKTNTFRQEAELTLLKKESPKKRNE